MPVRIALFEEVASRRRLIRYAWKLHQMLRETVFGDLLILGFGIGSYLGMRCSPHLGGSLLALSRYPNEQREVERLLELVPEFRVCTVSFSARRAALEVSALSALLSWRDVRRVVRCIRQLSKRYHFVALCRGIAMMFYYFRFRQIFTDDRPHAVIVANQTAPEALGLIAAAAANGIQSVFTSHATIAPGQKVLVPPCDLCLLDGDAALEVCRRDPSFRSTVIYKGLLGESRPMTFTNLSSGVPTVGLFLSAPVDQAGLSGTIEALERRFPDSKLLLRPHPVLFLSPDFREFQRRHPRLEVIAGATLDYCIRACDIVFSGNSNVHLEVLKLGVPSLYRPRLDTIPEDYYGFVASEIVLRADDISALDLSAVESFYSHQWPGRFKRYDAGYLEDPLAQRSELAQRVRAFLNRGSALPFADGIPVLSQSRC